MPYGEEHDYASAIEATFESDQEDALDWLAQAGKAVGKSSSTSTLGDKDVAAGVKAVMQLVPAIIRAIGDQPQSREAFYDLTGMEIESVDPEDTEAWGAIIGAIASAIPAVVSAVSGAVKNKRDRQRTNARPAQNTSHCPPTNPNQARGREAESIDAEAVQLAALIPLLTQLLPVLIPLINQVLLPMLTKSLPLVMSGISGIAKSVGGGGKREGFTESVSPDGAWHFEDSQLEALWHDTENWEEDAELQGNPEELGASEMG